MFNNVFGIHERSLLLSGERVGVLAANIANADTPNYKARDIDFQSVLAGEQSSQGALPMARTNTAHLAPGGELSTMAELKYRIPFQPSLDGNTVEAPVEQAKFAENQVRYQASLMMINRRISSIENALTSR
ncbi:MAG: flagellar basal body rod protein FlgB [Steroidobacteraceae bacterium]|jgi:flagellar basal-body rod protein FlgB|nr:flagellar basal body rod protein FlgB [Steroidobacteraceae bacterium]